MWILPVCTASVHVATNAYYLEFLFVSIKAELLSLPQNMATSMVAKMVQEIHSAILWYFY